MNGSSVGSIINTTEYNGICVVSESCQGYFIPPMGDLVI